MRLDIIQGIIRQFDKVEETVPKNPVSNGSPKPPDQTYTPRQVVRARSARETRKEGKYYVPTIDKKRIEKLLKRLAQNYIVKVSIHKETGQYIFKILDPETHRVVREFPQEKFLNLVAELEKLVESNHAKTPESTNTASEASFPNKTTMR